MISYYFIKYQLDEGVVGKSYPQVSCKSQALAHQFRYDQLLEGNIELRFALQKNTKLTDILSQAAISSPGLLVSEKVFNILNNYQLMNHSFFSAIVETKKGEEQYYWLHLVGSNLVTDAVDYSNTQLSWTQSGFKKGELSLKSFEDFSRKKTENGILWGARLERISTNNYFDRNLDLFAFTPLDLRIYVSTKLKQSLSENFIQGVEFIEAKHLIVE